MTFHVHYCGSVKEFRSPPILGGSIWPYEQKRSPETTRICQNLLKGELPFPTIENHGKQLLFFIFPKFKSFLLDDYMSKIHATYVIWKLRICTFRICEKFFLFLNSHRLMVHLRRKLSLVEIVKFLPKHEISENFNFAKIVQKIKKMKI